MSCKTFTLTLLRHGQTKENKLKIIQGQMESMLTDLGRSQAKLLCKFWSETNERFDKVYSSHLKRAYETCEIVCDGKYNIVVDRLLCERAFGVLQGLPLDNLRKKAYEAGFNESNFTQFRPEGGETMEEVQNRIRKFCLEELYPKAQDSESILIVTHGGVVREFMKYFKSIGCEIPAKDFIVTPNTALNRFEITLDSLGIPKSIRPIYLHNISHLESEAKNEALSEEQLNDASQTKEVEHAI